MTSFERFQPRPFHVSNDLQAQLEGLNARLETHGVGAVVYSWQRRGWERLLVVGEGAPWDRTERTLDRMPDWASTFDEPRTVPDDGPEALAGLVGHRAYPLRFRGQNVGVVFSEPVGLDWWDGELSLLAAQLLADRDAEELRRLRQERYEHLTRAESLAATGMLSAGVAHELNNPLNVVLGLSRLMAVDDTLPEQVQQDASVIVAEASRAVRVVGQLLSYGRGGGLEHEPVELGEVAESCASFFEATKSPRPIRILRRFLVDGAFVMGDPFRLQQALLAILENARQAIVFDTEHEGRIIIEVSVDDEQVHLSVLDNGPGVPPDVLPRIFDPFFTTREVGTGTGMGLALVHKTVTDVGGGIRCENGEGGGARFSMWFPRHMRTTS